jgi:redox-sensitive bicupin YhaK (pirin superfamily)
MIIVHQGALKIQDEENLLEKGFCAVFERNAEDDQLLRFTALNDDTKFIMLAGKPIKEPIVSYGPFVLSSDDELE